ncbi:MAG: T9SS type A sorting domain-containing protein, partial [Bacteroidota bacterium]
NSQWYAFTPEFDGAITINSCEFSGSDNHVFIYTGDCATFSGLTLVAANDNAGEEVCPLNELASFIGDFAVTAGTTYYIEWIDRWSEDAFSWELSYDPISVDITFLVDMSLEDVAADGVFIAGEFSDFQNIAMADEDSDGIYTAVVAVPQNAMQRYKFKNGADGWEGIDTSIGDNCTVGDFGDRQITTTDMNAVTDLVCFGYCVTCNLVDVSEVELQQGVSIFPNPTKDQLQVQIELPEALAQLEVRLVNTLGAVVLRQQWGGQSVYQQSLDVSQLPAGTYTLQLLSGDLQVTRRVIVQ